VVSVDDGQAKFNANNKDFPTNYDIPTHTSIIIIVFFCRPACHIIYTLELTKNSVIFKVLHASLCRAVPVGMSEMSVCPSDVRPFVYDDDDVQ